MRLAQFAQRSAPCFAHQDRRDITPTTSTRSKFVARSACSERPVDIGKPRMLGWLHTCGFFAAIAAGVVLVTVAATIGGGLVSAVGCAIA